MTSDLSWRRVYLGYLQKALFVLLVSIFVGLDVCTVIDILPQSLSSGQFWNAIIVISAIGIIAICGVTIYIMRIVRTRKQMNKIPRSYQLSSMDIPRKVWKQIQKCRQNCDSIFASQLANQVIQHPGVQNPRTNCADRIETHYNVVLESLPVLLENTVTDVNYILAKQPDQNLEQYLEAIKQSNILGSSGQRACASFLNQYERARFSGKPLMEHDLINVISLMCDITADIYAGNSALPTPGMLSADTSKASLISSVRSQNGNSITEYAESVQSSQLSSASVVYTPARPAWLSNT